MAREDGSLPPLPLVPAVPPPTNMPAGLEIAVVDSDSGFVTVLVKRLEAARCTAAVHVSAPPVEQLLGRARLDAVVIDLGLLGEDAWAYLELLCSGGGGVPVIVCSGPSTVSQRVLGLRLGADDWLTKPCHPEEVLARVGAAVRRRRSSEQVEGLAEPTVAGELEIRPDRFEAFVHGRALGLTRREFELLRTLAGASGRVLERERIYEKVWGYTMAHGDRSVDVFVRKLRQKLETASPGWLYLHTHFGVGYRFEAHPAGEEEPQHAEPATVA